MSATQVFSATETISEHQNEHRLKLFAAAEQLAADQPMGFKPAKLGELLAASNMSAERFDALVAELREIMRLEEKASHADRLRQELNDGDFAGKREALQLKIQTLHQLFAENNIAERAAHSAYHEAADARQEAARRRQQIDASLWVA